MVRDQPFITNQIALSVHSVPLCDLIRITIMNNYHREKIFSRKSYKGLQQFKKQYEICIYFICNIEL